LVRRHHRTEISKRKPPPALPTGAWVYVLFQALAGAVLPDNDDCDATLFQSATSHEADANTRYSSKQGDECSRWCSGTARVSRFIADQSCGPTYSVLSPKPGGNQAPKYSGKGNRGIKRVGLNRGAARKLRLWGFESSRAAHRGVFEG